jgi:hypothetical protein|tara:strand:+ start:26 stop:244 length:219 start_codon:yes stop_codon:yes gene_type:complete
MYGNNELWNNYYLFLSMQNNLDTEALKIIFNNNYRHYELKWNASDHNLLYFMNMLDSVNKEKIINWGKKTSG